MSFYCVMVLFTFLSGLFLFRFFYKFFSSKRQLKAVQISSHYCILENKIIFPEMHFDLARLSVLLQLYRQGKLTLILYFMYRFLRKQNTPLEFYLDHFFCRLVPSYLKNLSSFLIYSCVQKQFWYNIFKLFLIFQFDKFENISFL